VGETSNISKIAEILATELFSRFLWNDTGGWNQSWKCVKEDHVVEKRIRKKKSDAGNPGSTANSEEGGSASEGSQTAEHTLEKIKVLNHPSDVVFYYDEPYSVHRTYVNTDLKSYKKGSITSTAIGGAVQSLALTLECAELSEEWKEKFVHEEKSYRIVGLLFIYNHDGEYDSGFDDLLAKVNQEKLKMPRNSRIFVLGPRDIRWLDNVQLDILMLYGNHVLPHMDRCSFYYPDLVRRKKIQVGARAAILEMLTGPWIILSYPANGGNPPGYVVYFRGLGKYAEEFLYLLDHLMHYQMVKQGTAISIRTFDADENAPAHFKRAVDEYIENYDGQGSAFATLLRKISFDLMPQIKSQFSQVSIGMKRG
jgi:hypothetical protein